MQLAQFLDLYIKSTKDLERFARRCKCHAFYLQRISRGHKPGPELAINIEVATGGLVSRSQLRPDIWGDEEKILAAAARRGARPWPLKSVGAGL